MLSFVMKPFVANFLKQPAGLLDEFVHTVLLTFHIRSKSKVLYRIDMNVNAAKGNLLSPQKQRFTALNCRFEMAASYVFNCKF
jgi:hypothetical protein